MNSVITAINEWNKLTVHRITTEAKIKSKKQICICRCNFYRFHWHKHVAHSVRWDGKWKCAENAMQEKVKQIYEHGMNRCRTRIIIFAHKYMERWNSMSWPHTAKHQAGAQKMIAINIHHTVDAGDGCDSDIYVAAICDECARRPFAFQLVDNLLHVVVYMCFMFPFQRSLCAFIPDCELVLVALPDAQSRHRK